MTLIEFILKINGKFPVVRKFSQKQIKKIILNDWGREKLNRFYNRMNYNEKSIFHALFSKIFRDGGPYEIDSFWIIEFAGKKIKMPLHTDNLWLDWETAISILGHDAEIKRFYEEMFSSDNVPKCFFDIGSNYGTHSLLFLSHKVETVSFEPNPNCQPFFDRLLEINGLTGKLLPIALGSSSGKGNLVFPEKETWMGSLHGNVQKELDRFGHLVSHPVQINKLDEFIQDKNLLPDLIKIDTEGFELEVLQGAKDFLLKESPIILFESQVMERKNDLFEFLIQMDYKVKSLNKNLEFSINEYFESKETNFLAIKSPKNFLSSSQQSI